jgi:adenylate cyclase
MRKTLAHGALQGDGAFPTSEHLVSIGASAMNRNRLKLRFSFGPKSITTIGILLVLALFLLGFPFLDFMELKTYDLRFLSRGIEKPDPRVVAAVLDERSLDEVGRWPWPRAKFAEILGILDRDGAKVVAFDIGFIEPDENNNLRLIQELDNELRDLKLENEGLNAFLKKRRLLADNDRLLAESMHRVDLRTVLGYFFYMSQSFLDYELTPEQVETRLDHIRKSKYPLIIYDLEALDFQPFRTAYAPEPNLSILHDAATGAGYFNMEPDPQDGIVRTMPLMYRCGTEVYAPLSIQAVWNYLDRPQLMVKVAPYGIRGIRIGDNFIPTDEMGYMRINYLGPERTFPHYSLSDVLQEKLPQGTFQDKIVIIGASSIGIGDIRNTPFSSSGEYPGLEIHATVIDNILKGNYLSKPKWATIFDVMAIIVLGLLTGLVVPRLSAIKAILSAAVLFVSYILLSRWLFVGFGFWVNMVYPLLAILLVYTALTVYHYLTEERERKKIRGAFSYYVSSSVVNEMLKDPSRLKLGGDKKELSVLFSDIRSFTSLSEGMTPEDLVHLLNEYLTVMTDIVFKYEGTLDKYIGDAVMAIYGAPLEQSDHPQRACASALEMMEGLKSLNEKWINEGKPPLDIGIGINTGMMMVGNMGSEQRFDYTVMGDAVNLGSRLEGANKSYKTHILISESTYARVRDEFVCMELDSVRVKGKNLPVRIYELVSRKALPSRDMEAIARFHEGLQWYKAQEWDRAIHVFEGVNAMDQTLYAAQLYIQRCRDLKADPPGPGWDGVYTMTTK